MQAPFFGALHALAIDDGGGRAGFAFAVLPALQIQRVMDAIERSVVAPQIEIVEQRAARRQVLRDCSPLASRAQNIHDPVHHFAHVDRALVAAGLRWRDQWCNVPPTRRRSDHSDIAIGCGRIACGSLPSTSVTLLESGHHS